MGNQTGNYKAKGSVYAIQRGQPHKGAEQGGEGMGDDVDEWTEHVQNTGKASPCGRYSIGKREGRSWEGGLLE